MFLIYGIAQAFPFKINRVMGCNNSLDVFICKLLIPIEFNPLYPLIITLKLSEVN